MAGLDHADTPCRHAMAVTGGGDADQPRRLHFQFIEIVPLGAGGERSAPLADGKTDHSTLWNGAQMPAQHHIGMRRGNRRIENRAQERASVGHRILVRAESGEAVIRCIGAKENPRGAMPGGGAAFAYRPIGIDNQPPTSPLMMSPKRSQISPLNLMSCSC